MMSSHTLEELVSIAADIRPGDDILTGEGSRVSWERVTYISRRDGRTRYVTPTHVGRANDAASVFIRRAERAS